VKRWLLLLLIASPCAAAPVVPSFRTGTMTSRTESTLVTVEQIRSVDFNPGYTYAVTGTGVSAADGQIAPGATTTQTQTIDGVDTRWTGLDMSQRPGWQQTSTTQPFQYTEHYSGPGLANITTINRTQTLESITESTSVFGP
jgi:hypothetical protein|tara:strand:- start:4197 stop:4622 length:426 start_codon:yes stop_codon:yes gene_type:complete